MSAEILLGIIASLAFAFFFPGIEYAFLASNKSQLVVKGKQGSFSGKIMAFFVRRTSWLITTTHVGYVISLFFFSLYMVSFLAPRLSFYLPGALNTSIIITVLLAVVCSLAVFFFVELITKSLFVINPNQVIGALSLPFAILFVILFPIVFILSRLDRLLVVNILRKPYAEDSTAFALTDLTDYLKIIRGVKYEARELELDKKIFHNAIEFKTVRIRECMIPRTEIVGVRVDDGIDKLRQAFIESGHSKILVYKTSTDDIIGYCHSSALFRKPAEIEHILTPIITVPETTMANDLMIQFINENKSVAVVMDEFGGTSGIVSMEDIIEEIFGEIEDEHDEDDLTEQQIDRQTFMLSARLEIDYLNEKHDWNLPSGDYETLGGLLLASLDDFPKAGETVKLPPYTLTILAPKDNRIGIVKLRIEDPVKKG